MHKSKGFMGRTHAILSIMLMFVCMLIPLDILKSTVGQISQSILFFMAALTILVGGSLLPDLDNIESSAKHSLGLFGSIFTIFMQTTAASVWAVYHGKRDKRPNTFHRYFWHAPIIGISLACLFYFGLPSGEYTIEIGRAHV